jgi:hypothetical protein
LLKSHYNTRRTLVLVNAGHPYDMVTGFTPSIGVTMHVLPARLPYPTTYKRFEQPSLPQIVTTGRQRCKRSLIH